MYGVMINKHENIMEIPVNRLSDAFMSQRVTLLVEEENSKRLLFKI